MSRAFFGIKKLWYTRCPVPTSRGIADQLGWIEAEFDGDRVSVQALANEVDARLRGSHFDHWLSPLVGPGFLLLSLKLWGFGVRHYRSIGA